MSQLVYIVSIDIKDGWYDIIHVFTTEHAALAYQTWQLAHSGDDVRVVEMPLEDAWVPPPPATTSTGLFR